MLKKDSRELDKILINLDLNEIRRSGGEINPGELHYTDDDFVPAPVR
jgi:hypothetical protein